MTATGHKDRTQQVVENLRRKVVREHTREVQRVELAADAMARIENLESSLTAAIDQLRHVTEQLFHLTQDHEALKAYSATLAPMAHSHPVAIEPDGKGGIRIVQEAAA